MLRLKRLDSFEFFIFSLHLFDYREKLTLEKLGVRRAGICLWAS